MEEDKVYYYVFCVINEIHSLGNAHSSNAASALTGREIYLIPYKDISAVVSKCHTASFEPNIDNLERHEDILANLLDDYVVLPMKFSTVFSDENEIISVMTKYYSQFIKLISQLENKVELGIKVFCHVDQLTSEYGEPEKIDTTGKSEAQIYMLKKFSLFKRNKAALEEIKSILREMHSQCKTISVQTKINKSRNENILLNAAYLVDKNNIDKFKQIVNSYNIKNKNYALILSGPWAPYNFASIKQEGDSCE